MGIKGGSCSGKTYFVSRLLELLGNNLATLISQDNYYWPIEEQPKDAEGRENFDLPESFDKECFIEDLRTLLKWKTVKKQEHVFNNPALSAKTLLFEPAPIILVEGIFVFHFPEVAAMLDLKLFVDAPEHIKIKRRVLRDRAERGYELDQILYQYEHHVAPNYNRYILPHRDHADVVINSDRKVDTALNLVSTFLNTMIK